MSSSGPFRSVDELIETRMRAMRDFLVDFPEGVRAGRYVDATLPTLPFAGPGVIRLAQIIREKVDTVCRGAGIDGEGKQGL